ncbi:MAG TPA: collagen-like protein [Solirubrobacterales bacterium]|jgi:hypothetical protein
MLNRIHQKLGTAGFIISIVALLAALGGGAYAASGGLTSKQKKEVTKIAQTEAKKLAGQPGAPGPTGAPGAKGDTGPKGADGINGTKGDKGDPGTNGSAGENVNILHLAPHVDAECEAGGAKFFNNTGTAYACNGEAGGGGGGGYPATLPSGSSETGAWEVQGENGLVSGASSLTMISFPLQLAAAPTETIQIDSDSTPDEIAKCGGSAPEPSATVAGILCLYSGMPASLQGSALHTYGALLIFPKTEGTFGSWAVKAP